MSETSSEAARSMLESAVQLRSRVMAQIESRGATGATCDEVEVALGLRHQTASARIRELSVDDLVADSGARRLTRSGRRAVVWVAGSGGLEPPLRYVGGKRWLLPRLRALWVPHRRRRLVEPFVGGMSVALGLRPERALLCDAGASLIKFYLRLRDERPFSIEMVNSADAYLSARARFNELVKRGDSADDCEVGEIFYYLNRTCFNGVVRHNRAGGFNVPYGKRKSIEYRRDFAEYASLLRQWEVKCQDFAATLAELQPEDLIFADPPYDGTFQDYAAGSFSWGEQERLAIAGAEHDGPVVMTNRATDRIVELYSDLGYSVDVVEAPIRVAANGDRSSARELIATRNLLDCRSTGGVTVSARDSALGENETAEETADEEALEIADESEFENEDASANESDSVSEAAAEPIYSDSDREGGDQMAFLPKGWGAQVANSEATVQRQNLRDGEYQFLHKSMFRKDTQDGPAVIIEHKIIESKKTHEGVDPMPAGTSWGYFMPEYGKAKVMLMPNTKAYVLGLLGIDEKKMIADLVSKGMTPEQAKANFAQTLGDTIDSIADERMAARGMLIRGVTFRTKTDEGKDFVGMNWFPVPGENGFGSPSVMKRRAELDAESVGGGAPANGGAQGAGFPSNGTAGNGVSSAAPASTQGALPPPPQQQPSQPLPPPPDPFAAFAQQGWQEYPGRPDCAHRAGVVKYKADLIAGR